MPRLGLAIGVSRSGSHERHPGNTFACGQRKISGTGKIICRRGCDTDGSAIPGTVAPHQMQMPAEEIDSRPACLNVATGFGLYYV
jgi:hypothetical protein